MKKDGKCRGHREEKKEGCSCGSREHKRQEGSHRDCGCRSGKGCGCNGDEGKE